MRFSIRDLLWLTALVAMGIGWTITQARSSIHSGMLESHIVDLEYINEGYKTAVEKAGYAVYYTPDKGPHLVDTKKWKSATDKDAP